MGLQIPESLIMREVPTAFIHLPDIHPSVAKTLQDAVVIHYLGFAGRQEPEFLQLKAFGF
jgi:hypothetical protein